MFIWNEGAAQHFGGIGGDYYDIYGHDKQSQDIMEEYRNYIAEIKNDSEYIINDTKWNFFFRAKPLPKERECEPQHYFRNISYDKHLRRIRLMNALQQHGIEYEMIIPEKSIIAKSDNTLYFIPFKDYTDPLWNMHNNPDCTHYCTWPQLWEILWDSMYRIIVENSNDQ